MVEGLKKKIKDREKQISRFNRILNSKEQQIKKLIETIDGCQSQISNLKLLAQEEKSQASQFEQSFNELRKHYYEIIGSTSWLITKPLRSIVGFFRGEDQFFFGKLIERLMRKLGGHTSQSWNGKTPGRIGADNIVEKLNRQILKYKADSKVEGFEDWQSEEVQEYFDEGFYRQFYPDYINSGMIPIEHYFKVGCKKLYNPSPYFDTEFYILNNLGVNCTDDNPLVHYANFGEKMGLPCQHPIGHHSSQYFRSV